MVWQRIDDQFGGSKKVLRIPRARRFQVIGLWTLAGNYACRVLTDGVLEAHELEELGARKADITELVRVDLWHGHGHSCEKCVAVPQGDYVIHDFLEFNYSRERVTREREAERIRKDKQRQAKRARPDGSPTGTPEGTPAGSDSVSEHPDPVPIPTPLTGDTHVSPEPHPSSYPQGPDEESIESLCTRQLAAIGVEYPKVKSAIAKAAGRIPDPTMVVRISATILERAIPPVKSPTGIVVTAVKNDWAEWQKLLDEEAGAA